MLPPPWPSPALRGRETERVQAKRKASDPHPPLRLRPLPEGEVMELEVGGISVAYLLAEVRMTSSCERCTWRDV